MDEQEKQEEQCQTSIDIARAFEMSIFLMMLGKIRKVLSDGSKRAKATALHEIRKYVKEETKAFLKQEKEAVRHDLMLVGESAYDNLDKRSKKQIKCNTFVSSYAKDTDDYFKKYMKTSGNNYILDKNTNIYQFFNNFIEQNVKDVVDGKVPIEKAISDAVDKLAQNGLKIVDYASGRTRSVEVFVRQQMLYASKESVQDLRIANAKKDGITIWEFDAHPNARPSHQKWQGKRYDETGKYYPKVDELTHGEHKDFGCKHDAFPVYNKDDPYMFTKEQLENINTEPFEWNGKTYDGYEATQKMRAQERTIRDYKKRIKMKKEQGVDTTKDEFLLKKHNAEYTSFCKTFGTYRRSNRLKIA